MCFCASFHSSYRSGAILASDDATNTTASEPITAFSGGITRVADPFTGGRRFAAGKGCGVAVIGAAIGVARATVSERQTRLLAGSARATVVAAIGVVRARIAKLRAHARRAALHRHRVAVVRAAVAIHRAGDAIGSAHRHILCATNPIRVAVPRATVARVGARVTIWCAGAIGALEVAVHIRRAQPATALIRDGAVRAIHQALYRGCPIARGELGTKAALDPERGRLACVIPTTAIVRAREAAVTNLASGFWSLNQVAAPDGSLDAIISDERHALGRGRVAVA